MSTLEAVFYDILHRDSIPSRDQEDQKKTFTHKLGIAKFHSISSVSRTNIFCIISLWEKRAAAETYAAQLPGHDHGAYLKNGKSFR